MEEQSAVVGEALEQLGIRDAAGIFHSMVGVVGSIFTSERQELFSQYM